MKLHVFPTEAEQQPGGGLANFLRLRPLYMPSALRQQWLAQIPLNGV